jgi:hypothetical protein
MPFNVNKNLHKATSISGKGLRGFNIPRGQKNPLKKTTISWFASDVCYEVGMQNIHWISKKNVIAGRALITHMA